eukprot:12431707-Ditylum_brightwellii.AAC.1
MVLITNRNTANDLFVDWPSSDGTNARRTYFNKCHLYEPESKSDVRFSHATNVRFIDTPDEDCSSTWYE